MLPVSIVPIIVYIPINFVHLSVGQELPVEVDTRMLLEQTLSEDQFLL